MGFEAELREYLSALPQAERTARASDEIQSYALELGLVRGEPGNSLPLTALATAFLRLRGRAAGRWLLIAEVLQSTGRGDPWRTPRALLAQASKEGIVASFDGQWPTFAFNHHTIFRLSSLGVLRGIDVDGDDVSDRFEIAEDWRPDIDAVLADGPWHRAISAILDEAHADIVATATGMSPVDAISEQSKLIAHEVRNALVPVRHHLDALRHATPAAQISRLDAARRGVVRVLDFAEELVTTSELIAEAASSCNLANLVRDAAHRLEDGDRVRAPSELDVRMRAPKLQLTRAISNVIRNALQATTPLQPVHVSLVTLVGGTVRLVVDDGGPGVPIDQRERVFQEGFTTRTDGSGYGLAYVRRVIADELRGKVWCEASDLGGARFVIELPEVLREP